MVLTSSFFVSGILSIPFNSLTSVTGYLLLYCAGSSLSVWSLAYGHGLPSSLCYKLMPTPSTLLSPTKFMTTFVFLSTSTRPSSPSLFISMSMASTSLQRPVSMTSPLSLGSYVTLTIISSLFPTMARITLANWTCSIAHCNSPIVSTSPAFTRSYMRF